MDYSSVWTLQNTSKPITFRTPLLRISVALVSAISIRFNMRHGFMAWRKPTKACVFTGCLFSLDTSGLKLWFFLSFRDTLAASNGVSHIDLATFFTLMIEMSNFFPPFCFSSASPACVWRSILAQNCSSTTTVLGKAPLISFSAFISF